MFILPNFPPGTKVPDAVVLEDGEDCFVGTPSLFCFPLASSSLRSGLIFLFPSLRLPPFQRPSSTRCEPVLSICGSFDGR